MHTLICAHQTTTATVPIVEVHRFRLTPRPAAYPSHHSHRFPSFYQLMFAFKMRASQVRIFTNGFLLTTAPISLQRKSNLPGRVVSQYTSIEKIEYIVIAIFPHCLFHPISLFSNSYKSPTMQQTPLFNPFVLRSVELHSYSYTYFVFILFLFLFLGIRILCIRQKFTL